MPKFSNGKITSNVIFYNRGIPNNVTNFAWVAGQNYSLVKQIYTYNKNTK